MDSVQRYNNGYNDMRVLKAARDSLRASTRSHHLFILIQKSVFSVSNSTVKKLAQKIAHIYNSGRKEE